jgi:hypothetical protein
MVVAYRKELALFLRTPSQTTPATSIHTVATVRVDNDEGWIVKGAECALVARVWIALMKLLTSSDEDFEAFADQCSVKLWKQMPGDRALKNKTVPKRFIVAFIQCFLSGVPSKRCVSAVRHVLQMMLCVPLLGLRYEASERHMRWFTKASVGDHSIRLEFFFLDASTELGDTPRLHVYFRGTKYLAVGPALFVCRFSHAEERVVLESGIVRVSLQATVTAGSRESTDTTLESTM